MRVQIRHSGQTEPVTAIIAFQLRAGRDRRNAAIRINRDADLVGPTGFQQDLVEKQVFHLHSASGQRSDFLLFAYTNKAKPGLSHASG